MVLLCSLDMYKEITKKTNGRNFSSKESALLEVFFMDIVKTMIYELIKEKESMLLSEFCSINHIQANTKNLIIKYKSYNEDSSNFDMLPIIEGVNAAFNKNLEESYLIYLQYKDDVLRCKKFNLNAFKPKLITQLEFLDSNLGRVFNTIKKDTGNIQMQHNNDKTNDNAIIEHEPKLIEKLNEFAVNRKADDSAIIESIQQLQTILQNELQQIAMIREGIEYKTLHEAILQFTSLFFLIDDVLKYHPDKNKEGYNNLIESCVDFAEHIKQSLAMLGVTIINDIGKPYDTEYHKATQGAATRQSIISKVIKIGFSYNKNTQPRYCAVFSTKCRNKQEIIYI